MGILLSRRVNSPLMYTCTGKRKCPTVNSAEVTQFCLLLSCCHGAPPALRGLYHFPAAYCRVAMPCLSRLLSTTPSGPVDGCETLANEKPTSTTSTSKCWNPAPRSRSYSSITMNSQSRESQDYVATSPPRRIASNPHWRRPRRVSAQNLPPLPLCALAFSVPSCATSHL